MRNAICLAACLGLVSIFAAPLFAAPASPEFFKTQNSDEWVSHTFKIQAKYDRVLVVTTGEAPKTVSVAPLDLNARMSTAKAEEYPVVATFATIQEAADAAKGGDLVAVMPGTYAGFVFVDNDTCADGKYVHFKAMGKPGEVTINSGEPTRDRNWMAVFRAGHHAILEGFNIAGNTGPGLPQTGPNAGIFLCGTLSGGMKQAHHIVLINNFSHNHRAWGMHSVDTHTVLMQGNCFALSSREHSAYVSDGSDNYCIRRNVFFGSTCSGLQCNLDPLASLNTVTRLPGLTQFARIEKTPETAQTILKAATELLGASNYPDGQGFNFIIEDNVINANGKNGGGSLNLAGLKESLIQNNLIYNNLTTGIAEWDNANEWDAKLAAPGPSSAKDVKGPESLPFWGCQNNLIRNNTVVMNVTVRKDIDLKNGSWGNVIRNNIGLNDLTESLEVNPTSVYKVDSGYNVFNKVTYDNMPDDLRALAVNTDEKNHSTLGVTLEKATPEFAKMNANPWIIIEGNWWRLNPDRPDFHPKKGSDLFAGKGDARNVPALDIDGNKRGAVDIGAYVAAEK